MAQNSFTCERLVASNHKCYSKLHLKCSPTEFIFKVTEQTIKHEQFPVQLIGISTQNVTDLHKLFSDSLDFIEQR